MGAVRHGHRKGMIGVGVTWLSSYPKSGNTWMRLLLFHLTEGGIEDLAQVNDRIPDLHRQGNFEIPDQGTRFIKTHFVHWPGHPLINQTDRVVYIIRNPKDVLLSLLDYTAFWKNTGLKATIRKAITTKEHRRRVWANQFIRCGGMPHVQTAGFGRWAEHAMSWLICKDSPVLLVRFEDMKRNTVAELRRVRDFCGLEADETKLKWAVEQCELGKLRKLEGKSDASKGQPVFFNKGRSGASLADLHPSLDARFDRGFAQSMRALGYKVPDGTDTFEWGRADNVVAG